MLARAAVGWTPHPRIRRGTWSWSPARRNALARTAALVLAGMALWSAAACSYVPTGEPAPATCQPAVYQIDRVTLPRTGTGAAQLALDLDGDGTADNRLGRLHATLAEFFADWRPDDHLTARLAGPPATAWPWLVTVERCQGTLAVGLARGQRTDGQLTPIPGGEPARGADGPGGLLHATDGTAALPLTGFTDGLGHTADPGWVTARGLAVALAPSPDRTTLDATIGAGLDLTDPALAPVAGFLTHHLGDSVIARTLDTDRDHTISVAELRASTTVAALIARDIDVDHTDGVLDHASLAFTIHATAVSIEQQ